MWDEADEDWSGDDDWSDEASPTIPCPECGADVYEESEHCPACGHFLLPDSSHPWLAKPAWFVILGLVGILATLIALAAIP
jgi:hypothetical protein